MPPSGPDAGAGRPASDGRSKLDGAKEPIDPERLDALRRLEEQIGEPVLWQVVDAFLRHGDQLLAVVRDDLRTGRLSEVAEAAHSLAGSAAAIGAFALAHACRLLERHARGRDPVRCLAVFEELLVDYQKAAEVLRDLGEGPA